MKDVGQNGYHWEMYAHSGNAGGSPENNAASDEDHHIRFFDNSLYVLFCRSRNSCNVLCSRRIYICFYYWSYWNEDSIFFKDYFISLDI